MGKFKELNIKNQTYYFFNDIIDSEKFSFKLIKNRQEALQRH